MARADAGAPAGAAISKALPPESSMTPRNCDGLAVRFASFFRSRVRPFAVGVTFCGAGLSRMFWSAGKNAAWDSFWPVSTVSRKPVEVGSNPALNVSGGDGGTRLLRRA